MTPFSPARRSRRGACEVARKLREPRTSVQRAVDAVTIGHRSNWPTAFGDGADDGFLPRSRSARPGGGLLHHFAEDADFRFFPSARNFIAGVVEGFESGAYRPSDDEQYLEEDTSKRR